MILGLIAVDLVMATASAVLATMLRFGTQPANLELGGIGATADYIVLALVFAACMPGFLAFERLYDVDSLFWGAGEFSRVARAVTLEMVSLIIASYLLNIDDFSRLWLVSIWVLTTLLIAFGRWASRMALRDMRRRHHLLSPTLLVGLNRDSMRIARALQNDPSSGMVLIGCVVDNGTDVRPGCELMPNVPVLGEVDDIRQHIATTGADSLLVVSSAFTHATVSRIVSELRRLPVDVHICSGLFDVLTARVLVREVAGTPIMMVKGATFTAHKLRMKRSFDVVFSGLVVLVGMPFWLLIAAAIKLDSPGPVFYRQQRVGRNGSTFGMFKFRSMHVNAEAEIAELQECNEATGPLFKMRNDPRITRVGHFLRRYSIDEIPQFINVLRGEMSVVGPRPPLPVEALHYSDRYAKRLEVAPGMTGLWQVSGRSDLTFDEMVRLDLFYIENWSLRYDLALVLRTIPTVLLADGAY